MKHYKIYPNFAFEIIAENEIEANAIAYELLKKMTKVIYFNFDFDTEEIKYE